MHTFFRQALQQDRLRVCRWLFAGKMTLGDARAFEPLFEAGVLAPPRWLPPWVRRAGGWPNAGVFVVRQPDPDGPVGWGNRTGVKRPAWFPAAAATARLPPCRKAGAGFSSGRHGIIRVFHALPCLVRPARRRRARFCRSGQ